MLKTVIGALSGALLFATAARAADRAATPSDPQIAQEQLASKLQSGSASQSET